MKRTEKMKIQKLFLAKETLKRIDFLTNGDLNKARGGVVTSYWGCASEHTQCYCACTYALELPGFFGPFDPKELPLPSLTSSCCSSA